MKEKEMKRVPKLRFPEFTDDWEQRKVGEVTKELLDYDNFSSGLPLLTSSRSDSREGWQVLSHLLCQGL